MALEQLSLLSVGRAWAGTSEPGLGEDFVSGTRGVKGKVHGAISLLPTLRKEPRRMGQPHCEIGDGRLGDRSLRRIPVLRRVLGTFPEQW